MAKLVSHISTADQMRNLPMAGFGWFKMTACQLRWVLEQNANSIAGGQYLESPTLSEVILTLE